MSVEAERLGPKRRVSRKEAALQQINMAIRLFKSEDYACAITLSLAAEQQLPPSNEPHLWRQLIAKAPDYVQNFNYVRDWLKHHKEPDEIDLFEFEVAISIARAATKFVAVYRLHSKEMSEFFDFWRDRYSRK